MALISLQLSFTFFVIALLRPQGTIASCRAVTYEEEAGGSALNACSVFVCAAVLLEGHTQANILRTQNVFNHCMH
jgi:hypothetical protein